MLPGSFRINLSTVSKQKKGVISSNTPYIKRPHAHIHRILNISSPALASKQHPRPTMMGATCRASGHR
uniref:Uncharacterized protein n=1 Tax=Arundo donax TaxID=35708 RepID=A0A0A8YSB7_ARUDO